MHTSEDSTEEVIMVIANNIILHHQHYNVVCQFLHSNYRHTLTIRDVVLGTCIYTQVVLEYHFKVLELVLVT